MSIYYHPKAPLLPPKLNDDVARCNNNQCPSRELCARFTDRPEGLVYFAEFTPIGDRCGNFISNDVEP